MALAAGRRNVELGDRRLRVGPLQDVVRAVAIGTNCGVLGSARHRFAVNALFVGSVGRGTDSAAGHHQLLAVAGAAGRRNVDVRDFRLGIARRQNLVNVAVAVLALGYVGIARCCGLGVDAVLVRSLLIGVAGGAHRLRRRGVVRKCLDVGVAVGATERTVDGRLELRVVHMQADLLAVLVFRQSGIAMTGQTIIVAHLRGFGGGLGGAAAIAGSNKASTTIQLLRFTEVLSLSASQDSAGLVLHSLTTI